jgi:hypothetical protein
VDSPAKAIIDKQGLRLDLKKRDESRQMEALMRQAFIMNWEYDFKFTAYMESKWGDWDIWKQGKAMEE